MSNIVLKPHLRQELKLSPQILQSMKLLQMNSQELLEYLETAREENPLIEQEEPYDLRREYENLRRQANWVDAGISVAGQGGVPERGRRDREIEGLQAFLADQLDRMHLPKARGVLCKYLAQIVDEDGYLPQEDLDALPDELPKSLLREALDTIQSLDPPGVGARDLSECLMIQLSRRGEKNDLARRVVQEFLPQLGQRHYGVIARAIGVSIQEIEAAAKLISELEPHPGRAFLPEEDVSYLRPDVFIAEVDGQLQVILNEYYLPRITISGYYLRLLEEADEKETREYLKEKLQQAKWVIWGLESRGSTLRRCAQEALETQRAFFAGNTAELVPMSLKELSEKLSLNPGTVSRAICGKYLQCRQGTYPLRYFFSGAVGEAGPSQQAVKQKILLLVKEEDAAHPLSDQAICEFLAGQGIRIARRTVAKYRIQLGIPSSAARKK